MDFVHFNGVTVERLLTVTTGRGVAIFDYNNDGFTNVIFVSGTPWPQNRNSEGERGTAQAKSSGRLYQNDREAQFWNALRGL